MQESHLFAPAFEQVKQEESHCMQDKSAALYCPAAHLFAQYPCILSIPSGQAKHWFSSGPEQVLQVESQL